MAKSNQCEPQKEEHSGVSIVFGIFSGFAGFAALYTSVLNNPSNSIHQIYYVTEQIKYLLWAILFMCVALYWKK